MTFNYELVAAKIRRWGKYLDNYRLPTWEEIPDIGLYMEQVIVLLKGYLDYLPPELKEEQFITRATINNYVRLHIMPQPVKKRYYRYHIACLIVILTLKSSVPLATIKEIISSHCGDEDTARREYTLYAARHRRVVEYFADQVRIIAAPMFNLEGNSDIASYTVEDLTSTFALMGSFSNLFYEKVLLLNGKKPEDYTPDQLR